MNKINKNYDIVIVGGGMIGAAITIGLAKIGWQILLIEEFQPTNFYSNSKPDLRVSAINYGTKKILEQLGAWNNILNMRTNSYKILEVWEQAYNKSHIIFDANDIGISELGYIIENRILQLSLWNEFNKYLNLTITCPNKLISIYKENDNWQLMLSNQEIITTKLLIGADGQNSHVRYLAGITSKIYKYSELCMMMTIKIKKHENITWQAFTPSGPKAFLPLFNNWACLIWYDHKTIIQQLESMSLKEITNEIYKHFPKKLEDIEVITKKSFQFIGHHANSYIKDGLVLVGDAAHTINPIAGQGINLGYRDIKTLLNVLDDAKNKSQLFYKKNILKNFQKQRILDNECMRIGIHAIYKIFNSNLAITKFLRQKTLSLVNYNFFIKQQLLKYATGIK
uniref:3-demethoxyubiquinol 3-hydroxylase n=1 Tax=Candidatus Aschnera chinzeii TaxID=1485666 RepID=A0AAT9G4V7_9ENTR|nr:MAG: 3-demethoxyubiquinol 3-hydroxylase [Candidatus Aschnera chinzeii]